MVKNLPAMWENWFDPSVGKIPWGRKWVPTPVFLPGESHGQKSLMGYSPWNSPGQKSGVGTLSLLQGIVPARDQTQFSHIAGRFFTSSAIREAQEYWSG